MVAGGVFVVAINVVVSVCGADISDLLHTNVQFIYSFVVFEFEPHTANIPLRTANSLDCARTLGPTVQWPNDYGTAC